MKNKHCTHLLTTLLLTLFIQSVHAAKLVKITLTGTCEEDIEMTVGNNGRVEIISYLPYEIQVSKDELPITLKFRSEHYKYVDIHVPTKPVDNIGHYYIVKPDETFHNTPQHNDFPGPNPPVPVPGIDLNYGVNKAPYTGHKSENTYALIIANSDYKKVGDIESAANDGLVIKEYMIKTFGLSERQILYYPNATSAEMMNAIEDIKNIAQAYDGKINLLVYYAGHGIPDNATKDAYIMPVDVDGSKTSLCYSLKKLYREIGEMNIQRCVVLLDACFSGTNPDGNMIIAARGVAIKPKEEKPKGNTIILTAATGEQTAFSYKQEKHGVFTYFLLKYLQEKKGKVQMGELADYITKTVSQESININGKQQTPTVLVPANMADNWRSLRFIDYK